MSLDERADALDKKLEENPIDTNIATLVRDANRRRWQIRALAVSLVLDVLLTIGFGFLAVQARDTALSAAHNQASIIASCDTGNEFRSTEAALWQHIIAIQPVDQGQLTPEQEAQRAKIIADFQVYLKTAFAPRDCSNIIKK